MHSSEAGLGSPTSESSQPPDSHHQPSSFRLAVGLVLGAGGIRGCAHAGVIATLREASIPIDLVVGASVGSIFGLALCAGLPAERMVQVVRDATAADLFRFYAGRLRPDRSNPIARMLFEAGDGKHFSDLAIPLAIMATDMATGRPVALTSGPVLPAIQASIALPFIARPVRIEDCFYVDGGLLDTAPVGVAREMGANRVIAVCLGSNYTAPHFLRRRLWTRSLLERLGKQQSVRRGRSLDQLRFGCRLFAASFDPPCPARDADCAIWPEFGRVGPNSMFGAQFCFDQGLQAAREALPEIEQWILTSAPGRHDADRNQTSPL